LEENVGAVNVSLSANDLQEIQNALEEIKIVGDRYPAALQARVGK
jgi:aryl-alcohol dehydrogenase-like predicted oxidoreductase